MKSGYTVNTSPSLVLGAGLVEADTTPIGVTRGDVSVTVEKTWRNADFNGKGGPVVGLDSLESVVARFSVTLLEFGADDIARFNLSTSGVVPSPTPLVPVIGGALFAYAPGFSLAGATIARSTTADYIDAPTGELASTLLAKGNLVPNLRLTLTRGDGSLVRYVMDWARVIYSIKTNPKSEGELAVQFEARLEAQGSPLNIDAMPYRIESVP